MMTTNFIMADGSRVYSHELEMGYARACAVVRWQVENWGGDQTAGLLLYGEGAVGRLACSVAGSVLSVCAYANFLEGESMC